MAGSRNTPGAVHSAYFTNDYLVGPLSWIIQCGTDGTAAIAPIKAIWRNEIGTAATQTMQVSP